MKAPYPLAALPLALAATVPSARADEPGRIVAATVYAHGAIVERELKVPGGTRHVVMPCVPDTVETAALRIDGAPDLKVGEIVLERVLGAEEVACREAARDPRAKSLAERKAMLDARVQSDQAALDYLKRWSAPGEATTPLPPARGVPATRAGDPAAAADSMRRAVRDLVEDLAKTNEELKAVASSLSELDATAAGGQPPQGTDWYVARFDVATAAPATLRLRYHVENVSWTQTYRATLDPAASTLQLERLAILEQGSREAWNGVAVTLSTTDPSGKPQGPLPTAWEVGGHDVEVTSSSIARVPQSMAAPVPVQRVEVTGSAIRPDVDLAPRAASVDQRAFETLFTAGRPLTIGVTSRRQVLVLESVPLHATLRTRIAPRQDTGAWLVAEAPRPDGVWPVASMDLYRDGQFAGTARWGAGEDDKLTLPFGRDPQVRVIVEHPVPRNADRGLFGGRLERRWSDAYTVRNDHSGPAEIEVVAAMPVSSNEKVKVTTTLAPEPTQRDWHHQAGVVAWNFTLAPKASQRIDVAHLVEWPSDVATFGF